MNYKVIIMDRNGHTSKFVLKDEPEISEKTITLHPTPFYTLTFVICNLTSYSITKLKGDKHES